MKRQEDINMDSEYTGKIKAIENEEKSDIKDSVKPAGGDAAHDNPHRTSGNGDAQIREILADLKRDGFGGYLSLEPHLTNSTHVSGTKAGKWAAAAQALQTLLDDIGIQWQEV